MMNLNEAAGRMCPLRYRYGPNAIAKASTKTTDTLYVVGGLYGNLQALDVIEQMASQETGPVTLCFNGDFNWFNVDSDGFAEVNRRVRAHDAIVGNVEAELSADGDAAGCGCAYPESVDSATVERSNRIHARLKHTANDHPSVQAYLATLPMFARYRIADCHVGVVHGDAESLAGWRFDAAPLADPSNDAWLCSMFDTAQVDAFASTHTCQPALKTLLNRGSMGVVVNNGAAGMPNFPGRTDGLITRIGIEPSPHTPIHGARCKSVFVDALAVPYNHQQWCASFLRNWPTGSDAHTSYFSRIDPTKVHR